MSIRLNLYKVQTNHFPAKYVAAFAPSSVMEIEPQASSIEFVAEVELHMKSVIQEASNPYKYRITFLQELKDSLINAIDYYLKREAKTT